MDDPSGEELVGEMNFAAVTGCRSNLTTLLQMFDAGLTNGTGIGRKNKRAMNTQFQRSMLLPTLVNGALTLAAQNAFGLGGNCPDSQPVNAPFWPAGMRDLAGSKSRIGSLSLKVEDVFYYAGTAPEFSTFLAGYAKIRGIEKHRLILHRGAGEMGSSAGGRRRPCDWKLQGRPGASRLEFGTAEKMSAANYVLEVHFWTEGRIALDQVLIPKNIEVASVNPIAGQPKASLNL